MKRISPILGFFSFLLIAFSLILSPQTSANGIQNGLRLCTGAILPNLFPFFVFSEIWIRSGNAEIIAHTAQPMMKYLFHISGTSALPMLLGAVGGYPIGARTVAQLYTNNQISKHDAEQALLFCNNAGPAFIIGVIGLSLFRSTVAGILLYAIHILTAMIIGIVFRPKNLPNDLNNPFIEYQGERKPFYLITTDSITHGGQTTLQVCIYIVFFSLISMMAYNLLSNLIPENILIPLLGILELTTGTDLIGKSFLHLRTQYAFAALLLGFGGFCVMFQSLSIISPCGLSGKKLFKGKILQGTFSGIIAYLIWPLLPDASPCFQVLQTKSFPVHQFAITFGVILTYILITKLTSGKWEKNRI